MSDLLPAAEKLVETLKLAKQEAKKADAKYFILEPYNQANQGEPENWVWPLVHEEAIEPEEKQDIFITVFPSGTARIGEWKCEQ